MDTKRLYVDFHVLQTVPPSCVNRDDTGSPKTAVYGGAVRARESSQAWKHAMRVMFTEEMSGEVEIGKRTLRAIDLVADELAELLPGQDRKKLEKMSQDALKMAGITFKKSDKKDGEKSDNTSALLLIGKAQAMALDIMVWFNIDSLFVWPSSFTLPNILRAAGDARVTMTVSSVAMWAFRVGCCYLAVLCFGGGLLSIWMGMYLDWVFRSLCFYLRFCRGSWLEQSVI